MFWIGIGIGAILGMAVGLVLASLFAAGEDNKNDLSDTE